MVHQPSSAELDIAPVRAAAAWQPLAVAAGTALAYALFLALPFYANHLDRFPLEEVAAGAHTTDDMWPGDNPVGFVFALGGLAVIGVGPLVAVGAIVWSIIGLVSRWRHQERRGAAALVVACVIAVGTLGWLRSDFASALIEWWLD